MFTRFHSGIPEEVLRRKAKLKQGAEENNIETTNFFEFLEILDYTRKITLHNPVMADQVDDCLIAGNTIELKVENLFNGGEIKAENGVRLNGIFGLQVLIKRENEVPLVDDLMPFLYILNSALKKKTLLPGISLLETTLIH